MQQFMRRQMRILTLLALCTLPAAAAAPSALNELPSRLEEASHAAPLPIDTGAKGLEQLLRKLRTRAARRRARGAYVSAAGADVDFHRRAHRWSRPSPGIGRNGAGGISRGR